MRALLLPLLLLLGSCGAHERVDFHLVGGGIGFPREAGGTREQAAAVVAEVQAATSGPEFRERMVRLLVDGLEAGLTPESRPWRALEVSWTEELLGPEDAALAYAVHSAFSSPSDWLEGEPVDAPAGTLVVRLQATTLLSPEGPQFSLAILPVAALASAGTPLLDGQRAREALQAVRRVQFEEVRRACAAAGLSVQE
jgi:hypothetical protein